MTTRRLAAWVTHERLDDEVIAINLETGAYFTFEDAAADCWTLIIDGQTDDAVADAVSARYEVDPEQARRDVRAFIEALDKEQLVEVVSDASAANASEALPAVTTRLPYIAPEVAKFDDLEELLLLDPIHEVDDAGWPVARQ